MKRINRLLILIFVLLCACAPKNPSNSAESFLWKIEREGSPASYLLGTVHINKIDYKLPAKVLNAMAEADILFTETNIQPNKDEQMVLALYMMNLKGGTSTLLGEELFNKVAEQTGIEPEVLDYFRPWAIVMILGTEEPEGFSTEMGVDMLVTAEADRLGMEKMYLESPVDAMEHFISIPEAQLHEAISFYIDDLEQNLETTRLLVDYYNNNAVGKTLKLAAESETPDSSDEFWRDWYYSLTAGRNKKWIRVLAPVIEDNSVFIAVGALHLFGEEGLIDLLSQQGYTLTPVF